MKPDSLTVAEQFALKWLAVKDVFDRPAKGNAYTMAEEVYGMVELQVELGYVKDGVRRYDY